MVDGRWRFTITISDQNYYCSGSSHQDLWNVEGAIAHLLYISTLMGISAPRAIPLEMPLTLHLAIHKP